mmetsp:Transcript_6050/g.15042  ORF Transcript_6050/g.15042 Transcript_6050/m.15042 type:complete len:579 (-) Transcript_6050:1626-3362(-)
MKMMLFAPLAAVLATALSLLSSVDGQVTEPPTTPKTTPVNYTSSDDGHEMTGHLSIPSSGGNADGKFPAVIIVPDWDGVNSYEKTRATLISETWGFVGFAADIYGSDLQTVEDFNQRVELANLYRGNATLFAERIQAAVDLIKVHPSVDPDQIAVFGYCFGGTGVIQYGLMGYGVEDVAALVSFHGGLSFIPESNVTFGPKILVLSGGDDDASSDIMDLEMTLDAVSAPWEITRYSGIEHAFTKWDDERYNPWADLRSWESAGFFILEAFGLLEYESAKPDQVNVTTIDYIDETDGNELQSYLAMPGPQWQRPLPAVVIFPDWDGVNLYEQERATALADLGYVALAADIYGKDLHEVPDFNDRIEQVTLYRSNPDLYMSRMQAAIDQVKALDDVDSDEIAIIGYCFGGSGVVLYSMSNGTDAKVSVPFHGGLDQLPSATGSVNSYVLVLSGGDDDSHGNQTYMEDTFNAGEAQWEITRYANILHGYTDWYIESAYNLEADARSWESMHSTFEELMAVPVMTGEDVVIGEDDPCATGADIARDSSLCSDSSILSDPSAGSMTSFSVLSLLVVAAAFAML